MDRFDLASEKDQGAITPVLVQATAFERVRFPVVWAWATHFFFPRQNMRVLCLYFEHQRRVPFEGRFRPSRPTSLGQNTKVYPPLKLKVFVDDITAPMEGRSKELAGIAEKVPKREVEEKGLKLSLTEGGKDGKSNAIASCSYLEENLQEYNKKSAWNWPQVSKRWRWT